MLHNIMAAISAKVKAAITKRVASRGNSGNLEELGTLGEFILSQGFTTLSKLRQKNGNHYIVLYTEDDAPFTLMFSNNLETKHGAKAYTRKGLVKQPCYYVSTDKGAEFFMIGVEGSRPTDVSAIDFAAMGIGAEKEVIAETEE